MSCSNQSNSLGGSNPPSLTEMQIMQTLCLAQNHNMQEVSNLAQTQESFTQAQTNAGTAAESKVSENLGKLREMSKLSTILGVVSSISTGLASAGSSVSGVGASFDAVLPGMQTMASGLGNGVGPMTEGGLQIAQGQDSKAVGYNKADSSVATTLMKGLDQTSEDSASTISTTVQTSAQMTSKEQSIISDDRQSKMYN